MTENLNIEKDLLGEVIRSKTFPKFTMTLYSSNIMHIEFEPKVTVGVDDFKISTEWVASFNDSKHLNLIEGGFHTDFEDEVREFSADENGNKHTIADAMVVKNTAQRMLANLYNRFNKPAKPTKVFSKKKTAILWLLTLDAR